MGCGGGVVVCVRDSERKREGECVRDACDSDRDRLGHMQTDELCGSV